LQIPPHVKSQIEIDTAAAMVQIAAVKAALAAVPAAARTSVGVDLSQMPVSGVMAKFSTPVAQHADGGTIHGPGSSTSDSVPIWASAGEEMIRAASAGFDRPFLKAYNANPGKALAEKTAAMAGGNISVQVVNKSGAAIGDLIEMYIENAAGRRKVNLSTGMQRVAY
jgi:hypothetical protein